VATSPFSLLGAAFGGGGEELSYEDFTPGNVDLSDANKKKLDVIVKALYSRPGLDLNISGSVDPVNDRDGLQRAALDKELRAREWMSLSRSKREIITPDQIVLTPEQRKHLVEKFYNEALAAGKITPAIITANTNLTAIAARIKTTPKNLKLALLLVQKNHPHSSGTGVPASSQPKLPPIADPKEALLAAIIPVSDNDLESLALERARAVRAYILQGGKVEAGRLFLTQSGGLRQDGNRVYLELN
jgi:hypothetical protein